MKFSLFFSALSLMAASPTALSACLNCTSPIGNSNWANGVLAGSNYYNPVNPTGTWGLGASSNGEGPLELRRDPTGFYYIYNICPRGHTGYCRVYLNQVIGIVAGETYNIAIEYQLANVRGATANTLEIYLETLPSRQRLFGEFIYSGNTAWTTWTTGSFVATTTANVLFTVTWRNDPNDAIVNIRRIDMKPLACRVANPNTSCAPSSTSTTTTSSSTTSTTTTSSTTSSSTSTTVSSTSTTSSSSSASPTSSTLATSSLLTTITSSASSEQPTFTPAYPPVQGYNWVDCYQEPSSGQRLLRGAQLAADDMTLEKCATFCASWPYFGTEYGRECFCGLALTDGGAPAPLSECNFPCSGNAEQVCGAGSRMNLYNHPAKTPANPEEINGGSSRRLGCVTEAQGGRTLGLAATASDDMTLEMCDTFCAGYPLWGVEYGRECYCGNELRQGAEVVAKEDCDMLCAGNGLQLCGAGNRVMVYSRQAPPPQPNVP
ncbi:WSC domain containing protein [Rhypophila sp. PSN 637]